MTTKKPHHMAFKAEKPCWNCGYEWLRPALDFSNPEAEELDIINICAKCKAKPDEAPAAAAERLRGEE